MTRRIPSSRYYRSGSTFPRYRKPSKKVIDALRVERVASSGGRNWLVEFEDGMGVFVTEASVPGRFFALKVHDRVRWHEEARPEPPTTQKHAYQYVALTQLVPHQSAFHIDARGDLLADVHEELYPTGRDQPKPKKGDRYDYFDEIWIVVDVRRRGREIVMGKPFTDRFGHTAFIKYDTYRPDELAAYMRKISRS